MLTTQSGTKCATFFVVLGFPASIRVIDPKRHGYHSGNVGIGYLQLESFTFKDRLSAPALRPCLEAWHLQCFGYPRNEIGNTLPRHTTSACLLILDSRISLSPRTAGNWAAVRRHVAVSPAWPNAFPPI